MYAAYLGRVDAVTLLHKNFGVDLNQKFSQNAPAIFFAVESGQLPVVNYLLDNKIDIQAEDISGNNAVHLAALKGHLSILKQLLSKNVSGDHVNRAGYLPLHLAIAGKQWHCVKYLLTRVHKLETDSVKISDIMSELIREDRITLLDSLMNRYSDMISLIDFKDMLFFSASINKSGFVRYLYERKLDIDIMDEHQMTPLMRAAQLGNVEVVSTLLNLHANPDAVSEAGLTALMYATLGGHLDVVRIMRNANIKN